MQTTMDLSGLWEVRLGDGAPATVHLPGTLEENGLVSGDESEYGLYVKSVNGIAADYDADGYYWALSKTGEYLMTGVDDTLIADGEQYELVRTAA